MGAVGLDSDLLELPLLLAELSVHPGDDFLEVRPLLRRGLLLLGQALLHGCKTQRCDFTRRPPGNLSLDLFEQKCARVRQREGERYFGAARLCAAPPAPGPEPCARECSPPEKRARRAARRTAPSAPRPL